MADWSPARRFFEGVLSLADVVRLLLFLAAALSVFITAAIVYILVYDSVLFFREVSIIDFLTDTEWTPVFENPTLRHHHAGVRHADDDR